MSGNLNARNRERPYANQAYIKRSINFISQLADKQFDVCN